MKEPYTKEEVEYVMREYGIEAYQYILERGLIPKNDHLTYAVSLGDLELTEFLLSEVGLDPNEQGSMAFEHAFHPHYKFDSELTELLFRYGANYTEKDLESLDDEELKLFRNIAKKFNFMCASN